MTSTTPFEHDGKEPIRRPVDTGSDTEGHIIRTYPALVDDQSPRRVGVPGAGEDDVEGHRRAPAKDDLAPRRVPPGDAA